MNNITVITPTYNRAYILPNLYESLTLQYDKDFLWLVIDDGSNDNTAQLIEKWIKENIINIEYIKQDNSGKHVAHNTGVTRCKTDFFICVDSDDCLEKDAIKEINYILDNKLNNEQWGIIGPKKHFNGIVDGKWPINKEEGHMYELYYKYKYKGETYIVIRTDLARKYLFPIFENEKFVPESAIYDRLDQTGNLYFYKKPLYRFEYQLDGYTNQKKDFMLKNINGYAYANKLKATLNDLSLKTRAKYYARYLAMNKIKKLDKSLIDNDVNLIVKIMGLCMYPIFYLRYIKKEN